jgi:hypothetical protein
MKSESEDLQGGFMHCLKHAVSCVSRVKLGRASCDGLTRLRMAKVGGGRNDV